MMHMDIHFINVGYGDAVLIEIPGKGGEEEPCRILVDTGSAKSSDYEKGDSRIPVTRYLKSRCIGVLDLLVLTHPHEDHIAMAVNLAEELEVRELMVNFLIPESAWETELGAVDLPEAGFLLDSLRHYGSILSLCRRKGIPVRVADRKGELFRPAPELTVRVLDNLNEEGRDYASRLISLYDENGNVPICEDNVKDELVLLNRDCNMSSLALLFEWRSARVLLTGDSCPGAWPETLLGELRVQDIHLFKLPHHGQMDSITPEAAEAIRPSIVVTSSSSDRRYGSSHPECYRLIREVCGEDTVFLFTDEVLYEPYFRAASSFNSLIVSLAPGGEGRVELFDCRSIDVENSRAEALV